MLAVDLDRYRRRPVALQQVPHGEGGATVLAFKARRPLPDRLHLRFRTRQLQESPLTQKIPDPLNDTRAVAAQHPGEAGPDDYPETLEGLGLNINGPTLEQLIENHGYSLDPLKTMPTSERTIYWTEADNEQDRNVLKVDWLQVAPKVAEERKITSNITALLMGVFGYKGVPYMRDSGIKSYIAEDRSTQLYSYLIQQAIPTLVEQGKSEEKLRTQGIHKRTFSNALRTLEEYGVTVDIPEVRKTSNYVRTVRQDRLTGEDQLHQVFVDNLWLEAEDFLTLPMIEGISRVLGTVKDRNNRRELELTMGIYLQQLFQISNRYGDESQKAKNLALLKQLGVAQYASEILDGEIPIYPAPSFPIAA